ncbi:MAG: hypothetical protein ABIP48_19925 [Planctomycetota bacterium]
MHKRYQIQLFATFIGVFVLTAIAVAIGYADWSALTGGTKDQFLHLVKRWPLLRVSFVMAIVTALAALAEYWSPYRNPDFPGFIMYPILYVPVLFMVFCPGLRALGLSSDGHCYWTIVLLDILHIVGFRLIGSILLNALRDERSRHAA